MSVPTFTKTGSKASVAVKLPAIFDAKVNNHELLKRAYLAYLANGRNSLATTKTRGEVRGGGRKPWRQKGTGRARFGSIRNPIWRGGGVVFGPTGNENYSHKLNSTAKRLAIKQALSLQKDIVKVIETFECKDGRTQPTVQLLNKIDATRSTLLIVSAKNELVTRATRNIAELKVVQANYLNTFDILNAHNIVISKEALEMMNDWLGGDK